MFCRTPCHHPNLLCILPFWFRPTLITLLRTSFASSRYSVRVAFTTFSSFSSSLSSSPWNHSRNFWQNTVHPTLLFKVCHIPRSASYWRSCYAGCSSTSRSCPQSSPCSRSSCPAFSCPGTSPFACPGPSTSGWCPAVLRYCSRWPSCWGWGSSRPRAALWRCRTQTWGQRPSCSAPVKPAPLFLAMVGGIGPRQEESMI